MQDNGGLAFFGVGYIDIHRADVDAEVAALALIGKYHRAAGGRHIGYSKYLFSHEILQITNNYSS